MMRYPWDRTEAALRAMAYHSHGVMPELDYVNPETGADVLPTMGFTAMMLAAGLKTTPRRRSCSSAFHIVRGRGRTTIDGQTVEWGPKDTFSAPVFATLSHEADEEAFLVRIHDRPLQEKLGYYEERDS